MTNELIHPTAERVVAAAIAQAGNDALDLINVVAPSDFSSTQLSVIVEATANLLSGVEPVDVQAIVTECRHLVKENGYKVTIAEDYVRELLKTDTRRATRGYDQTVKRMAWLRQFKATIDWANAELMSLPDPEEMYKQAIARLDWLKPPTQDNRFVLGWDTIDYEAVLTQRKLEAEQGTAIKYDWPVLWRQWNKHVRTLRPGMVGLISGPEGSGKTGYLEMIAEHWATKCHVVFVHLENAIDYTLDRRMSRHSRVTIDQLESGDLTVEEQRRVRNARQEMHAFTPQLHYFDAAGLTMDQIVSELRTRRDEGLCQAVVLDYLNKVRPSRGQAKLYREVHDRQADDLDKFKTFCESPGKKIVGFTAAQFNKDGKDNKKRASGTDIRGSGEFMDKVQLAVLIQRTISESEVKDSTGRLIANKGQKNPEIRVRVEKQNRGGEIDFIQIHKGEFFMVGDPHV